MTHKHSIPGLIFMLAGLTAMAPLAIDAYLPAIPSIADDIGASVHDVELSISFFLLGFGFGQLMGGPLSDHFGRRRSAFTGLLVFVVASFLICFIDDVHALWAFRILQALGGGIAVVNANAIIRDISSGKDSAKTLSNMALILMLAPLLAPVIGSFILGVIGWRAIFIFLLVYAVLLIIVFAVNMPETRVKHEHKISLWKRYWMVLSHRQALAYLFTLACAQGGLFAFITGSPSVYMGYFNLSENQYPIFFGVNILALIVSNRINNRMLRDKSPHQLLGLGQGMQFAAAILMFAYIYLVDQHSVYIFALLMMCIMACHSFIMSNSMSSTIEHFPTNSATATALLGACGFSTGALTGSLVGIYGDGTPLPMATVILCCTALGIVLRMSLQKREEPITQEA